MLIPTKCPVTTEKAKVSVVSDPTPAKPQPETDTILKWDSSEKFIFCYFTSITLKLDLILLLLLLFRSASADAPPVETIVPSVPLDEEVHEVKETAADVKEDKVEESRSPAVTQPRHTSPELTFGSEVA